MIRYSLEIGLIAGVGQRIEYDDAVIRIASHPVRYEIGADKACTSGNEQATHTHSQHDLVIRFDDFEGRNRNNVFAGVAGRSPDDFTRKVPCKD